MERRRLTIDPWEHSFEGWEEVEELMNKTGMKGEGWE